MKGPNERGARGALAMAAARRRRKHMAALRHLATAECHRDRARTGMVKAESIVDFGIGAGFDMTAEVEQLGGLRQALAIAEADLTAARVNAGLSDAA